MLDVRGRGAAAAVWDSFKDSRRAVVEFKSQPHILHWQRTYFLMTPDGSEVSPELPLAVFPRWETLTHRKVRFPSQSERQSNGHCKNQ